MVDHDLFHRELNDLAVGLGPHTDLHDGLHRLSQAASTALELDGAGITVQIPSSQTQYVVAADPVTLHVERRQDELQEGACVDAIRRAEIVAVGDLTTEQPWPRFTPVLLDAGFRCAAGVPIPFRGQNIGAVNLYGNVARMWTTEEFNAGRLIAGLAAGYLVNHELLRNNETLTQQLQFALDSRIIIEQAKGVMSGRHSMTADAAFEVMRSYARSRRVKLHDVARSIVTGDLDLLDGSAAQMHGAS